jgi:homogentisate 1,2-dioxygenase
MSEYMGLITGRYDNKAGGFTPGGSSLHLTMTAHGPDTPTFLKASDTSAGEQQPEYFDGGLAFMFETCYLLKLAPGAVEAPERQREYAACWQGMPKLFTTTSSGLA